MKAPKKPAAARAKAKSTPAKTSKPAAKAKPTGRPKAKATAKAGPKAARTAKAAPKPPVAGPLAKAGPKAARTAKPAPKRPVAGPLAKAAPPKKMAPRADLGAPVDSFFTKQPAALAPLLLELRQMIEEAAPEATSSIKWGMPFYMIGDSIVCALASFKAHVNLILPGPIGTYADPDGLLEGEGKTGRHLKLRPASEIPRTAIRTWLDTTTARARKST